MSGLEVVLGVTALLAGATGTWSPCGFSMVETLAPRGYAGAVRTSVLATAERRRREHTGV